VLSIVGSAYLPYHPTMTGSIPLSETDWRRSDTLRWSPIMAQNLFGAKTKERFAALVGLARMQHAVQGVAVGQGSHETGL
jgi:hypothetical protein